MDDVTRPFPVEEAAATEQFLPEEEPFEQEPVDEEKLKDNGAL
jgi:hypothetical protein